MEDYIDHAGGQVNGQGHILVTAVVAAALAAGCASPRAGEPATKVPQADKAAVTVILREFEFEPRPLKVKAGKVRFLLITRGSVDHDFHIPSVMSAMEHERDLVTPGKSKVLEVDLKPGIYEVVCTVPGHKEAGMIVRLEVSS